MTAWDFKADEKGMTCLLYTSAKPKYKLSDTRNIGIMAHIDAGKTTTTCLLYTSRCV